MATTLPFAEKLSAETKWAGKVHSVGMRFANTSSRGTLGFNPRSETVTLTWFLTTDEVQDWLVVFDAAPNGRFAYTCGVRGAVVLRPTDSYSFSDYGFVTACSMQFERV